MRSKNLLCSLIGIALLCAGAQAADFEGQAAQVMEQLHQSMAALALRQADPSATVKQAPVEPLFACGFTANAAEVAEVQRSETVIACGNLEKTIASVEGLAQVSSNWTSLGSTETRAWCRDLAHGLGFKYYWSHWVFGRTSERYDCYAGYSLWPF